MSTTFLLIGLFMLVLAIAVVVAPLRGGKESARLAVTPRFRRISRDSSSAYEDSLLALRDLEFDHQVGIVADDDHARVREHLIAEAAQAVASERGGATAAGGGRGTLSRVPAEGGSLSAAPRVRRCPRCGKLAEAADRFCGACGARLTTAKVRAG